MEKHILLHLGTMLVEQVHSLIQVIELQISAGKERVVLILRSSGKPLPVEAGLLAGKAFFLSVVFGDTLSGRSVVLFFMCL
ncbi:MAG: hypothetical protein ACQ9MH_18325 [Nitrospinales bacterium]